MASTQIVIEKYRGVLANKMLMGTVYVGVGMLIASFLAYVLQLLLGRLLTVEEFGEFSALLSLSYVLLVPSTALGVSIVKIVSELKAKDRFDILTKMFWEISGYALVLGFIITSLVILLRYNISAYLNLSNVSLVIPYAIFLGISLIITAPRSFLQGLLLFKKFSIFSVISGGFRTVFPVLFVLLGFGVGGVFFGMTVGLVLAFFLGVLLVRSSFKKASSENLNKYYKKILTFSIPVIIIQICMSLLNNVDLVLVKHFFDSTSAGIYAGTATIAKVLLFGTGIVGTVMFPVISEAHAKGEAYFRKFKMFLILQIIVVSAGVAVFILFPDLITEIMFGPKFLPSVQYLAMFAVFIGLYSMINFLILFYLAIGKTKVFIFLVTAVILQFVLINLFNEDINTIIKINIAITLGVLLSIVGYMLFLKSNEEEKSIDNPSSV